MEPACLGVFDCAMAGVADSAIVRAMAGARISFLVIVSSSRKSLGSFKSRIGSVPMPAFCRSARGIAVIAITGAQKIHKIMKRKEKNLRLALEPHQRGIERLQEARAKIGRASCRERVCQYV